jgi:hypothetical protein
MAYALVANGHVRNDLAQSFCFPHGTDSSVLIKEYVALSSIVGAHRLSRIMRMLADTFA